MMIGLKSMEFCVAEQVTKVAELEEIKNLSPRDQQIFSMLKIDTVSIIEEMDNVDLAVEASRRALTAAGITPTEVDMLIFLQSRAPAYLMSSEATWVQERLGIKQGFSFTVTDLGCANISNAILLAHTFLKSNPTMQNILITCGSKPFGSHRYREGVTIIGDGGMGVVVGRTSRNRIIDVKLVTDGKFWDIYQIDYKKILASDYQEFCANPRYKFELSLTTRNRFITLNQQLCQENQVEKIDGYIMQNLSLSAFSFNEDAFKIKVARSCYDNCIRYGHLGSIDILLNYRDAVASGELKEKDLVLIMNNSPVACWSSMLIEV